jgi:hypothetical protein
MLDFCFLPKLGQPPKQVAINKSCKNHKEPQRTTKNHKVRLSQQLQCWPVNQVFCFNILCWPTSCVGLSATWLASNFNAGLLFQHPVLANILVGLSATWLASNFNAGLLFQHPVLANILVGLSATRLASNFNAGLCFLPKLG